jgi:hypothetical protein
MISRGTFNVMAPAGAVSAMTSQFSRAEDATKGENVARAKNVVLVHGPVRGRLFLARRDWTTAKCRSECNGRAESAHLTGGRFRRDTPDPRAAEGEADLLSSIDGGSHDQSGARAVSGQAHECHDDRARIESFVPGISSAGDR